MQIMVLAMSPNPWHGFSSLCSGPFPFPRLFQIWGGYIIAGRYLLRSRLISSYSIVILLHWKAYKSHYVSKL